MLEKRFSYFLIGLATGAGVLALVAPKSGRETRRSIANQVHRGKKLLAKSRTKVRRSATHLVDRGKVSVKRVNGALTAVMEAGKSAFVH
jgi:gas vesicle protein